MSLLLDLVPLDGGTFVMGTDEAYGYAQDGEGPAHEVELAPFSISRCAVTNAEFRAFVEATGHRSDAEVFGWSFVFAGFLPGELETRAVVGAPWWRQIEGADWAHPEGPASGVEQRLEHPAVHVSWNDAVAFCEWSAHAAAHGGRMGVRGAGRARAGPVPVGSRPRAGWSTPHERVPGHVPGAQHRGRRLRGHRAGGDVRAERLRAARDDGERLGVDGRLVRPRVLRRAAPT